MCESISPKGASLKSITQEGRQRRFCLEGAGLKKLGGSIYTKKQKLGGSIKKAMAQGMENTVSNGQGPKPHSAIEKGEQKISSG